MAVAREQVAAPLTYEDYLAEGEINQPYEIIDGVRVFMPNPSALHQIILITLATLLRAYEIASRRGRVLVAPCDVLVRVAPLHTRQPDLLFISSERFSGRDLADPAPLQPAPELVMEISPSDRRTVLDDKINDYCSVGVRECWVLSPEAATVEVLRLTNERAERVAIHGRGDTVRSITFDDLAIAVADIFRIED